MNPLRASLGLCLLLFACPAPPVPCVEGDEPTCDAGALPPDFCSSQAEAVSDTVNCQLVVNDATGTTRKDNVFISRLPDGGIDKDWYLAELPTLTPRSLLHVNGGYAGVPQTAVNFSLSVLQQQADGGVKAIATGVDRHGTAMPKAVDLVIPFSESGAKLFVLAGDEVSGTQVRVDNRNPYSLFVQVRENPDLNEPNDTTPTPITLTAAGGGSTGSASGYLATNNDVDLYSFPVSTTSRQIIYLHLTGPTGPTGTPPPTPAFGRLAYTLFDPMMQPVAEGDMANDGLAIDLATARLAPSTGTYTLKVFGYKVANSTDVIKGDLTLKYDVAVQLLPDLDTSEPNDTLTTAKSVNLGANSSTTLTGKLSYVPDEEWFVLNLPARASPSVLRWKTTVAAGGGRFAPLSGVPTRQFRVLTKVTDGATAQDRQVNCQTKSTACPKGYVDPNGNLAMLVTDVCKNTNPTQCLLAQRNEEPQFANLKNHVGAMPIEANKATELYVMFRDEGQGKVKYADDRDWRIELEWADDADEASRVAGPTQVSLAASSVSTGVLSFGYGKVLEPFDINTGAGVRGPNDYDAVETDKDLFQFNFGAATGDQTWSIQWELANLDGGTTPPADLALELSFCSATGAVADGGLCPGEDRRIFAYTAGPLSPWYVATGFSTAQVLFDRKVVGGSTVITAKPVGCWCFTGARTAGGKFFANIAGINRVSNEPLRYTVRQGISAYPGGFTGADGGAATCPVIDGGCGFATGTP